MKTLNNEVLQFPAEIADASDVMHVTPEYTPIAEQVEHLRTRLQADPSLDFDSEQFDAGNWIHWKLEATQESNHGTMRTLLAALLA